ncbi:type 1 glutamine amidotransferase [Shewanella gelidii]|uniref:GMP synthase n=1 Tax=Shewanella gelidii TaxID=1642821 RepID=A0A917JWM2_9GAMM|nr:type 1 glutamine amidotransferase [Shewanella gelidii]MCL1098816.1 type 1 glutamine amidotransferase [Shewanella gelidii]GGI87474.1 GMP synthase [Shewanella gelidii]
MDIAVFQHHHAEGVGRIAQWAQAHGAQLTCFLAPEQLPQTLCGYDGLIVLGGPMNVQDNPMWMQRERYLIQGALQRKIPILAICLGAQLLAAELGARIYKLPEPECGWTPVTFTTGQRMLVPQWHYQGFEFDDRLSVEVFADSILCPQQAFRTEHILGLQFHPEWDDSAIATLQGAFAEDCPLRLPSRALAQKKLSRWLFPTLDVLFDKCRENSNA